MAPPRKKPARADFQKWARRDTWDVAECAMLILGFEPFDVRDDFWPKPPAPGFKDMYEPLSRSFPLPWGGLTRRMLTPPQCLAWAREKEYPIPEELEEAVNRFHTTKAQSRHQGNAGGPKWPWGSHETELLRHLAAAADRFWKNYDPSDPTTAPTNQQVMDWLKDRGVSDRAAEVMASILRADRLPTGPRK
jgi:hypothetical protein